MSPRGGEEPRRPASDETGPGASSGSGDPPAQAAATTPGAAGSGQEAGRDFDARRLRLGDLIAIVAAFALLFIMAGDWYSTTEGVRAREIEQRSQAGDPAAGAIDPGAVEDAKITGQKAERNAWEISSAFDVLVLVGLLAAFAAVLAAAALRAYDRSLPGEGPSASTMAALIALLALVLVVAQAAFRLGPDSDVTVAVGLPLGVAALGAIAFGSAYAAREEPAAEGASGGRERSPRSGGESAAGRPEAAGGATYTRRP